MWQSENYGQFYDFKFDLNIRCSCSTRNWRSYAHLDGQWFAAKIHVLSNEIDSWSTKCFSDFQFFRRDIFPIKKHPQCAIRFFTAKIDSHITDVRTDVRFQRGRLSTLQQKVTNTYTPKLSSFNFQFQDYNGNLSEPKASKRS